MNLRAIAAGISSDKDAIQILRVIRPIGLRGSGGELHMWGKYRFFLCVAFSVMTLAFAGLTAVPASASPWGWQSGAPQVVPDSTDHWYCFDPFGSVPAASKPRIDSAMDYVDTATVMYEVYTPTCGSSTDLVWAFAHPIPNTAPGTRGFTQCITYTGYLNLLCDQSVVWIDPTQILSETTPSGDALNFEFNINKTIRHETGHTMGMAHHWTSQYPSYSIDAMIRGPQANSFALLGYTAHDICHVDDFFGGPPC